MYAESELRIPSFEDLKIPFPVRMNVNSSLAHDLTQEWALRYHLISDSKSFDHFKRLAYAQLVARACPDADLEDLALLSQWMTFFFILDDQQDNAIFTDRIRAFEELHSSLSRTLLSSGEDSPGSGGPLVSAFADLCQRTASQVSPERYHRLAGHLRYLFAGQVAENSYRQDQAVPTVNDFISVRRAGSTVHANLDLIEICAGVEVPEYIYHTPAYQELILSIADVTCWCNDIWSAERDWSCGDPINFVVALRSNMGVDLQVAVDLAEGRLRRRISENIAAELELRNTMRSMNVPEETRRDVLKAVDLGRNWLSGVAIWYWSETTRLIEHARATPRTNPDFVADLLI
ncbi:terpene synthase family protein [Streptomyces sp. NPDC059534]|uniref:terpene synthase family protein n=1 Tax=Streptomyces sp. NPDC059534 TaxID=3346859 RepID=UPI00368203C8